MTFEPVVLFFTPSEVADYLHIARSKVYEMTARDEIKAVRIGGSWRIPRHWFFDDFLPRWQEKEKERAPTRESVAKRKGLTIYFLQDEVGGLIKIGIASNVRERTGEIQRMSPVLLRVLTTLPGTHALEAQLHARFAAHRRHGEWFDPSPDLLAFIATCADDDGAQGR